MKLHIEKEKNGTYSVYRDGCMMYCFVKSGEDLKRIVNALVKHYIKG